MSDEVRQSIIDALALGRTGVLGTGWPSAGRRRRSALEGCGTAVSLRVGGSGDAPAVVGGHG